MKKLADLKPVAVMGLSNTAAVVISELDDAGETVRYYMTTGATDMVKVHRAKVYYRASDGAPYFNSVVGRMLLDNFMRY